jgi:hypothetical protein
MVEWRRLQDRQNDWLCVHDEAIDRRRLFLKRALSYEHDHYTRAVSTLRHGRERLIRGFADVYFDQLELDSSVATTSSLDRLLELAVRPGKNEQPDPQRWFEALSRFDQAVSIAQIEMHDSHESLDRDMNDLLDFLSERLFVDGFEKIEVYCYHDPKSDYRVHAEDIGIGHHLSRPGLVRRKTDLTCRKTVLNEVAYIRHRIKDPFETWLKMQRQICDPGKTDPYVVNDRCGLTFIVESMSHLHDIALKLVEILLDDPRDCGEEIEPLDTNYGSQKTVDANNQHSSNGYKAAKTLMKWRGGVFEFQFLTFQDYFSIKRSLLDSNHDLYRLRQTLDFFLPLLWPKEIYDVDWANPSVRGTLRKWKVAQLGWRVNENE